MMEIQDDFLEFEHVMTNEEMFLDSLSEDELKEYLDDYYAGLEELEREKDEYYSFERESYTYEDKEGVTHTVPMNNIHVDTIGINAIPNDMDNFVEYLRNETRNPGGLFYGTRVKHNLFSKDNNKYLKGVGARGGIYLIFNKVVNSYSPYNVYLSINLTKFNNKNELKERVFEELFSHFDMDNKERWKLSRVDIAFTMFKDLSTYYLHKKGTQKYEIITRRKLNSTGRYEESTIEEEEVVETKYVGTRKNNPFYTRLYNKKRQFENKDKTFQLPKVFPHVYRLEVEIMNRGLPNWRDCLKNLTLKQPNYLSDDALTAQDKLKVAGLLADERLFSLINKKTARKYRDMIRDMKADDDIIPQLEKEFRYNYERVIDTVREWVGIDIDSLSKRP